MKDLIAELKKLNTGNDTAEAIIKELEGTK